VISSLSSYKHITTTAKHMMLMLLLLRVLLLRVLLRGLILVLLRLH
jgi:hypothetical protein